MKIVKVFLVCSLFFFSINEISAQKAIKLWSQKPPTENGLVGAENVTENSQWITNVSVAEILIYQPAKAKNNGMSVIICPGGGYGGLAFNHEGIQFAQWLNTQGITGIVLKYRMPNKHKEVPLDDAQQAIRYVREHAKELGLDPIKVGIAGFSAGGHLASVVSTHYSSSDGVSVRPDFSILFYPVVTMEIATHGGSKLNLLGDEATESEIHLYSSEKQVNNDTPPAILLLSADDTVVPPDNSIRYYQALRQNDISASMYVFPEGGHGWGMSKDFKYHEDVLSLLTKWLKDRDK